MNKKRIIGAALALFTAMSMSAATYTFKIAKPMDKTDRLRDYGLAFLLYEHGLGVCGYELIRELFIFINLILNSYLYIYYIQ